MSNQKNNIFVKVYELVSKIPKGRVMTYGGVAKKVGTTPRVVGFALNKNPNPIVVPCHRVVGKDGHLRGFVSGIVKKRKLLISEGVEFKDKMHICREFIS